MISGVDVAARIAFEDMRDPIPSLASCITIPYFLAPCALSCRSELPTPIAFALRHNNITRRDESLSLGNQLVLQRKKMGDYLHEGQVSVREG